MACTLCSMLRQVKDPPTKKKAYRLACWLAGEWTIISSTCPCNKINVTFILTMRIEGGLLVWQTRLFRPNEHKENGGQIKLLSANELVKTGVINKLFSPNEHEETGVVIQTFSEHGKTTWYKMDTFNRDMNISNVVKLVESSVVMEGNFPMQLNWELMPWATSMNH